MICLYYLCLTLDVGHNNNIVNYNGTMSMIVIVLGSRPSISRREEKQYQKTKNKCDYSIYE